MAFFSSKKGVEIAPFDGGPCAVCGASGGNCKGDSNFGGAIQLQPHKKDDPLATFIVPRRIYATEVVNGRKRRQLLYAEGARIRPEEARRLGLL